MYIMLNIGSDGIRPVRNLGNQAFPAKSPARFAGRLLRKAFLLPLLASLVLLPVSLPAFPAASAPISASDNGLAFTQKDAAVFSQVIKYLEREHYQKMVFDDAMSARLLDELLVTLDPEKHFFTQDEVAAMNAYRNSLDDQANAGSLDIANRIFAAYRQRVRNRLQQEINGLPTRLASFNYNADEDFLADRSKAAWPANNAELDDIWRKTIKAMAIDLLIAGKTPEAIQDMLRKRLQSQLDQMNRLNHSDFLDIYLNTLTGLYDPHTNYLSPARSEQFNISMRLSLEGIGAQLQQDNQYVRIVNLISGGPAEKQGQLQPSDRIVGVAQGDDGVMQDVVGWRLDDVVMLIRGPKGSVVRLEVIPASAPSETDRKVIRITRDKVKLEEQAASGNIINVPQKDGSVRKVGIIKLPEFYVDFEAMYRGDSDYRSTTRDVYNLVQDLENQGAEGLVIDLRNNGGGALKEATDLTGLFIDKGPVVQIRQSNQYVERESKSPRAYGNPVYHRPVVVLVDRLSASASEIFAAALQDYGRALIVGGRTFGKGTVQTLVDLSAGQLKLTVSKFYRVSGGSTQHKGVEPDIELPAIYDEEELGESSSKNALPWDSIHGVRHSIYFPMASLLPDLRQLHDARLAHDADFDFIRNSLALEKSIDKTHIDLEMNHRKQQLGDWRKKSLDLENARRKAKGLPVYENWDAIEASEKNQAVKKQNDKVANLYSDIYLMESSKVLLDLVDKLSVQGFYSKEPRKIAGD